MNWRSFCVVHLVLMLLVSFVRATEPPEKPSDEAVLTQAQLAEMQTRTLVRKIIKGIPNDVQQLTRTQELAVEYAAEVKDAYVIRDLLRIVRVRKFVPGLEMNSHRWADRDELREYPVAQALREIGYPVVMAICSQLREGDESPSDERMAMYGTIIAEILSGHAGPILKREQSYVVDKAAPRFDQLLQTPALRKVTGGPAGSHSPPGER